jgi:hypothetical protein
MTLARLSFLALCAVVCLSGVGVHADPLFRIHVRPSLLRRLTPRLPSIPVRTLVGLAPQATLIRAAVAQGKGPALDLLRHR